MKHNNLSALLTSQVQILDELLDTLKLQQQALVKSKREMLDDSVKKEEAIFNRINQLQSTIMVEIKSIDETEQLGLKEFKLSDLLSALSDKGAADLEELKALRLKVVHNVKAISRINFQNNFLIDNSRQLIKQIITTAASGNNAIFDRRV